MNAQATDSALLALHYQNENCHPDGKIKVGIAADADWRDETLAAAARLLAGARAGAMPIVHVRLALSAGYTEVTPNTPIFRQWIDTGAWREGTWGTEFHSGLEPRDDELIVTHTRNNGFYGSDLTYCLARLRLRHLVIAGVSTTFVVESTVRHATDIGYEVTVAADACSTGSRDMHDASLTALHLLAQVSTVDSIFQA